MDSSFHSILPRIPRQYHSCPNNIETSIVSFNRRCLTLLNDPKVVPIIQSTISQSIEWWESIKFDTKSGYLNINSISRIYVWIEDYSKPRFKSIFQSELNQTSIIKCKNNLNIKSNARIIHLWINWLHDKLRSSTSNPNNEYLASHCHGSLARMNWKEKIQYNFVISHQMWKNQDFYHSHSMKTKPYLSLSKYLFVFFCKNKSIPQEMIKGSIYKLSHLHQLASRVLLLAMASWGFFPIGFVPHHPGELEPPLPASQVTSLAMASKHELLPIFSFVNSPWRVECELVASKHASLPIFFFANSPWRVEGELRASKLVVLPLFGLVALCCLFSIFAQCLE